jgi:hypothetical protein
VDVRCFELRQHDESSDELVLALVLVCFCGMWPQNSGQ